MYYSTQYLTVNISMWTILLVPVSMYNPIHYRLHMNNIVHGPKDPPQGQL